MPNKPFYMTNDAHKNLYFIVEPDKELTRREILSRINHWLIIRNVYFDLRHCRKKNRDVKYVPIDSYPFNLTIHGLTKSKNTRKGYPVYNIELSS